MAAPSSLRKVKLNAARSKLFPDGSIRHGYDFVAPLTPDGRIDLVSWKGGPGGSTWVFELGTGSKLDEEETGFRFGDHVFRAGEYVSIREEDGDLVTFRVVSVS